ncbi:MAG TPA: phosphotransferase [Thermoanaerobaculia bacterium]|nr:phosphotransferase [Thermoanaerobaculia bacterium]
MVELGQLPAAWLGWVEGAGLPSPTLVALTGDVSTRRYFRVTSGDRTAVLAVYPEEARAVCGRFVATTRLLESVGVPVPAVLATDGEAGLMLVEDLGDSTLWHHRDLPWAELARAFETASELSARIATLPVEAVVGLSPPLDRSLLERELQQTLRTFLRPQGFLAPAARAVRVEGGLRDLCDRVASQPVAVCHRDFMARNLVPAARAEGEPFGSLLAVLDHQDLRCGPAAYDLASLLNDSLFPPPAVEESLLERFLPALGSIEDYHAAAAQRALKAVGTYAAFAERGHPRHLPLIGPTLERALRHLAALPETASLAADLRGGFDRIC